MADEDWLAINRANWDARVGIHRASEFYDLAGFRAGASTLQAFEPGELGDVTGKRLLHLQCHMGQDTLSWARLGAQVTGLDFSEPAIEVARELAGDTGLRDRSRFVVADVYQAPRALAGERFDVVYTGVGALGWLPDLPRWAEVVAGRLEDGGTLYLFEFHPFSRLLDDDGRAIVRDYFDTEGKTHDWPYTYTDGAALTSTVSVLWHYTLGQLVSSLATAGLRIDFLHEHDSILFQRFPLLEPSPDGRLRFPEGHPRVPLMYSLRATKGTAPGGG